MFMFSLSGFYYLNYYDVVIYICLNILLVGLIISTSIRTKFMYFILFLFLITVWGFFFSFDGILLLLLASEFGILMLLLLVILQNKIQLKTISKWNFFLKIWVFINLILYFFFSFISIKSLNLYYHFLYNYTNVIVPADLYIYFQFYFVEYIFVTYLIILILNIFCLFFMCFFYAYKNSQQTKNKTTEAIIIRRQSLIKQNTFKTNMRMFKK